MEKNMMREKKECRREHSISKTQTHNTKEKKCGNVLIDKLLKCPTIL
jgi:hypothetical protein